MRSMMSFCLLSMLVASTSHASAPARVTVVLKEKMSCREVKKLFQIERLFVQCNAKKTFARAWAAHYFGKDGVDELIKKIESYTKVETAALDNGKPLPAALAADIY